MFAGWRVAHCNQVPIKVAKKIAKNEVIKKYEWPLLKFC